MGRLLLDTSRVSYEVAVNPVPKLDQSGQQKFDRETKHRCGRCSSTPCRREARRSST